MIQQYFVGAHVSAANGIHNIFSNAKKIGAKSIGCFVRSQRRWTSSPLTEQEIEEFIRCSKEASVSVSKIVVHGSYLINLASSNSEIRNKSFDALLDEVKRCEALGIELYTFHPGSSVSSDKSTALNNLAKLLNDAINKTKTVTILIETMAGQGSTICGDFEDIGYVISKIETKKRIGVCLDTCHLFANGYDIRDNWNEVLMQFDKFVGYRYIKALHLNDSKFELGAKKDRHANIGKGKLGLNCFRFIMNNQYFQNLPMILETPCEDGDEDIYRKEIEMLYSMVNVINN